MKLDRPSRTAFRVALRRAAHQLLDRPLILDDPIALRIIGSEREANLRQHAAREQTRFSRYLRAFLVARSRVAEDALAEAVHRGVRQYVVLGAGLDTFAYRNPYPPSRLHVFEVDHPATQAWKTELLRRVGIAIPDALTFVPVDFEKHSLMDRLQECGLVASEPTFFSWLGVTMYLERETVMATIRAIAASMPHDGGLVFDYSIDRSVLTWFQRFVFWGMARRVASIGEPFKSAFVPSSLVQELKAMGLPGVEDLGPEEVNSRYFKNRVDHLKVGSLAHLMKVRF